MTLEPPYVSPRRTKLHPPRTADDVILRPRLLARLDRLATLSLIVAPAGYGKTTLISTWLARINLPSAWVSLDNGDSELRSFVANVISAIRMVFPDFGGGLVERLDELSAQSLAETAAALTNELNLLEQEFVLVFDDYHWIHEASIHQLIVQLLTHPPRSLHLVIASRHDPPFPWNLRTRSLFCELRARDLSFTPAETAEFLAKTWDRPVDAELAQFLAEQSEGWITSLRLAALSADRSPNLTAWPRLADGSRRSFADYFAAEVLKNLSESDCDLLVRTSILDMLTGDLCDFVLGNAQTDRRAAARLKQLELDGVFIAALDAEGTWLRLHPLFRSALRQRLQETVSSAEIALGYERAVRWHEEHGLLEEAIRYALAGGLVANAAAVVGRHRWRLLDEMDFHRLERWLNLFPPSAVDAHIDLLLTKAWLMYTRAEKFELSNCLEPIGSLLGRSPGEEQQMRQWKGEVATLRSVFQLCAGNSAAAVQAGQEALELTPRDRFYIRTIAVLHISLAHHMLGEPAAADAVLAAAAGNRQIARDLALLSGQYVRHSIQLLAADLAAMSAEFPKMLQLATARSLPTAIAWAHYFSGCAAYLQNNLNSARTHFSAVLDLADYANAAAYTQSAIGLALTRQAQGAPDEAAAVAASLQQHTRARRLGQMAKVAKAFAADLAARQGQFDPALRWLLEDANHVPNDATPLFYAPELAACRVALAAGSSKNLAEAHIGVERVRAQSVRTCNVYLQIQALALQAALHEAGGERQQALAALEQALLPAERGGVVRVFADLPVQMEPLLAVLDEQADGQGGSTDFLQLVRSAVAAELDGGSGAAQAGGPAGDGEEGGSPAENAAGEAGPSRPADQTLDSSDLHHLLTHREMDVLRLLDQRLTNKEIARRLGISTETVRQHTIRLFRKLNVENRRQAIVVARAHGLTGGAK